MSEWWTAWIRLQRQALDVQRKLLSAGSHATAAWQVMVAAQEAGRKAMAANVAAGQTWLRLWGLS